MKGSEIAALRKSAELTQEELAELLEVHRVTVAKWETSEQVSKVTSIAIRAIIDAFVRKFGPKSIDPYD